MARKEYEIKTVLKIKNRIFKRAQKQCTKKKQQGLTIERDAKSEHKEE